MKEFIQAPLPFQGQKRNFLKQFKEHLNAFQNKITFVDLFGSNGLLAHNYVGGWQCIRTWRTHLEMQNV